MMESDVLDVVVRALVTELKASEQMVRQASSLKRDLKMDSIAAVNVAFAIEDEFDIEIDVDTGESFDSVAAIVEAVQRAIDAKTSPDTL